MSQILGIIGLGRTGSAAASLYLAQGFTVYGFDTDKSASRNFHSAGGIAVQTPAAVAAQADVILIMVLNDDQVLDVIRGTHGILSAAKPGSTVVCMSTIRRQTLTTVSLACRSARVRFVDCPFTGGPARIAAKTLTLIAAGAREVVDHIRPVLEVMGKITYAGEEPGQAQAVKHCNQLLVGVTHAATMEVIALARRAGLDPTMVVSVVSSGIAGSDYFRLLSESVLQNKPSPGGLGQMCKDMAIVRKTVEEAGMAALVASAASEYFSRALSLDMSAREGADLIEVVESFPTGHQIPRVQ